MKIVVIDGATANPGDISWDPISRLGELEVYDYTPSERIVEVARDAQVIVNNKVTMTREIMQSLPELRLIALLSTGYNIIDLEAAKELGIGVANVPAYSTSLVAQHAFALLLELTDLVALHSDSVHNGEWDFKKGFSFWKKPLTELCSKTFGIIGFGSIGRRVAELARAFEMKVVACSRSPFESDFVKQVDLDTLLSVSDVISIHCPLTDATRGMIDARSISLMKKNALLINTSRGPVINERDLADALNSGRIAGAGLDVLSVEPPLPDNPLLTASNCFITPHTAWAARETRARLIDRVSENIEAYFSGRPKNIVNL